jgi:hypothetical protein
MTLSISFSSHFVGEPLSFTLRLFSAFTLSFSL